MIDYEQSVRDFQLKYKHFLAKEPSLNIPLAVKELRESLIVEEYKEFLTALHENDIIEVADGVCDLIYVLVGFLITHGMPANRLFAEVHHSNMTKTVPKNLELGEKYGTKTPKGPDFLPPDMRGILIRPERETLLESYVRLKLGPFSPTDQGT